MKQEERQVPKIKHSHQAYSKSLNASDSLDHRKIGDLSAGELTETQSRPYPMGWQTNVVSLSIFPHKQH